MQGEKDAETVNSARIHEIGLQIEKPKKIDPTMIIYDVEKELNRDELKEHLIRRNLVQLTEAENKEEMYNNIIFRQAFTVRENKVNWLVQMPGKFLSKLLEQGKIFMFWRTYRIKEYYNVTKCFKCYGYGHIAKHCEQKEQRCENCDSCEHEKAKCDKKDEPTCANCLKTKRKNTNHSVRSKTCPEFLRMLEIYKTKIKWD